MSTTAIPRPPSGVYSAPAVCYDGFTVVLHWLTAVLVISLFALAEIWGFLPHGTPLRRGMQSLHISLGVFLALVFVARLIWRLSHGRRLPRILSWPEHLAATMMHLLLYGLLALQIALGLLFAWSGGGVEDLLARRDPLAAIAGPRDAHDAHPSARLCRLEHHRPGGAARPRGALASLRAAQWRAAPDGWRLARSAVTETQALAWWFGESLHLAAAARMEAMADMAIGHRAVPRRFPAGRLVEGRDDRRRNAARRRRGHARRGAIGRRARLAYPPAIGGSGTAGAQEKTRTSTTLRPQVPETCASTNSATWASCGGRGMYPAAARASTKTRP